jgi:hypothetical protein
MGGILGGYLLIAIVNNRRPDYLLPNDVVRTRAYVDWVQRQNRGELSSILAAKIWDVARACADIKTICVDILVAKEDLFDKFGHPSASDLLLLETVATRLEEVRAYPSSDAYLDDVRSAARWREAPCTG